MLLRICRFIGPCMYLNYRKKNFFLCEFSTFIPIMVGLGNLAFQVCLKGPFIGNSIAHRKLQFQLILPSQRSSWKPNPAPTPATQQQPLPLNHPRPCPVPLNHSPAPQPPSVILLNFNPKSSSLSPPHPDPTNSPLPQLSVNAHFGLDPFKTHHLRPPPLLHNHHHNATAQTIE